MAVHVAEYRIRPEGWPAPSLRITVLADLHAARPWMGEAKIAAILDQAQALGGDLIAVLGDFPGHLPFSRAVPPRRIAAMLAGLSAPLGVWTVLGNHDWKDDRPARARRRGPTLWHRVLEEAGLAVLENRSVPLDRNGHGFSLAGLGSQRAYGRREGADDLGAALAKVPADHPVILLAHEPDIFAEVPERVVLTLSGHTHAGQIRVFGQAPVVPSRFGQRYAHGHIRERGRDLIVSAGLGCSGLPLRIGTRPELVSVQLG